MDELLNLTHLVCIALIVRIFCIINAFLQDGDGPKLKIFVQ